MAALLPVYRKDAWFPRLVTDHAIAAGRDGFLLVAAEQSGR